MTVMTNSLVPLSELEWLNRSYYARMLFILCCSASGVTPAERRTVGKHCEEVLSGYAARGLLPGGHHSHQCCKSLRVIVITIQPQWAITLLTRTWNNEETKYFTKCWPSLDESRSQCHSVTLPWMNISNKHTWIMVMTTNFEWQHRTWLALLLQILEVPASCS
jgi:hypothetical protein